jgi:hypothetical protein
MIQPIDRNSLKCIVVLGNDNPQWIEIPIIDDICQTELMVETNSDGYGRIYKTPEIEITFSSQLNENENLFNKIIDRFKLYGWGIEVGIEIRNDNELLFKLNMSVEFSDIETDMQYYFKGKFYIDELNDIIKDKESTEIDLLSTNSLDKTVEVTPIELEDIVTRFKALRLTSIYKSFSDKEELVKPFPYKILYKDLSSVLNYSPAFHYGNIIKYEATPFQSLNVIYSPIDVGVHVSGGGSASLYRNYSYWSFKENSSTEIQVNLKKIKLSVESADNNRLGQVFQNFECSLVIVDQNLSDNTIVFNTFLFSQTKFNHNEIINIENQEINHTVNVPVGHIYRMFLRVLVRLKDNDYFLLRDDSINILEQPIIEFSSIDKYPDTTTKASRFINIGEQIIKSITNNKVVEFESPAFKQGVGNYNFKDVFCTNGSYLRKFENSKFVAKFKDWKETLRYLFNSDYEVYKGKIFVGHYTEFRTDKEIYKINYDDRTNELKITFNERIQKNSLRIEYSKYEDDETNTKEVVHSECNFLVRGSKLNDLEVDIQIPYIADTIQIETTRRESFDKDSTKSTREDDDFYIIDCYEGTYNNKPRIINRRAELFDIANGIYSADTSYNLRFTLKRLLIDIYNEILAEITQYVNRDELPKLTLQYYKNNVPLRLKPTGGTNLISTRETTENVDIMKSELNIPIVSGLIYEIEIGRRFKFNEWQELVHNLFTYRGYITFYDNDIEIKLYPVEMKYIWYREELTIKGELKYDRL